MQIQPPNVTGAEGAVPTTMESPPPSPQLMGTLGGIAQQLSMAPSALRSSLASGASITDLAAQQGVSRSTLLQSVEAQVQQNRQARGLAPLDGSTLDRMVNRAFDRHRGHGARAAESSGSAATSSASEAAAPSDASIPTGSIFDLLA